MKREVLTFLLFVVLATLMWYGHAMQSERNARVPVLIQYTGRPGTVGLAHRLPDTVMIEVRDAGARLNAYYKDPLRLTINLRKYIHGESGTIRVPSDVLRRSISDILQGTSQLIATSPEQIECDYFAEQEKTVPVALAGELRPADEYQLAGEPVLSHRTVKIYGPDKTLKDIDTLYTQQLAISNLSDTTRLHAKLVIPQGVRASQDSVSISIIAERFTEKKFTVPVHTTGVPEGYAIRLFPPEVEVSARVGMSHFTEVQASDLHAVCRYTADNKDKLEVEVHFSDPAITSAWVYPSVVEFLLIEKIEE